MNQSKYRRNVSGIIFLLLFSTIMSDYAFAHRVTVFAWVEGDTIFTESKFSGGKKAQNATVEVFDGQDHKLLEGKTNENGEFSFKAPKKTEMKIVLLAGMGHKGEWTIPAEEFEDESSPSPEKPAVKEPAATKPVKMNEAQSPCLTSKEIQDVVEKAVQKKLKPAISLLHKSLNPNHGPTLSDIFGGIGYIFGLMGIGAYFNFRKKKSNLSDR